MKKFIVFEGIDGAGSTTISKYIFKKIKRKKAWISCPGKDVISRLIHQYLECKRKFSPNTLLFLFAAAHSLNTEKIKKWLDEGRVVLADRYFHSTLAFQSAQGIKDVKALTRFFLKPDAVIYLRVSPETGQKRKMKQRKKLDKHEKNTDFLAKVMRMYDKLAKNNEFGTWYTINAERPIKEVLADVQNVLSKITKALF